MGSPETGGTGIYIYTNSYADILSNPLICGGVLGQGFGIYQRNNTNTRRITINIKQNTKILGSEEGDGYGIYVYNPNSLDMNIDQNTEIIGNEGTTGTGYAFYTTTNGINSNYNITNNTRIYGSIKTTAAYGIYVYNNYGQTNISGNGTIAASRDGNTSGTYYGIYFGLHDRMTIKDTTIGIYGSMANATNGYAINHQQDIVNYLYIENNPEIIGIKSGNSATTGAGIYGATNANVNVYGSIKNNALIKGSAGNITNAYGIYYTATCSANTFDIDNNTNIIGTGGSAATYAYGIYFDNGYKGQISNSASIIGAEGSIGNTGAGIKVDSANGSLFKVSGITSRLLASEGNCATCYGLHAIGASSSNLVIENMAVTLKATNSNVTDTGYAVYLPGTWQNFSFLNNTIETVPDNKYGMNIFGLRFGAITYDGLISGNNIKTGDLINSTSYGMYIDGAQSMNTVVSNNSIVAGSVTANNAKTYGMFINNVNKGLTVKNNTLIRGSETGGNSGSISTKSDNIGIYITGTSSPTIKNNPAIIGSLYSKGTGIVIESLRDGTKALEIDSNLIKGSDASQNNSFGIQQITNAAAIPYKPLIKNNIIKSNDGSGTGCIGISLYNASSFHNQDIISNNIIYGGKGGSTASEYSFGISLYNSITNSTYMAVNIINNLIYNDDSGTNSYGIGELFASNRSNPAIVNNNMIFKSNYYYYDENATSRDMTNLNNATTTCSTCTTVNNITSGQTVAEVFTNESI